MTALIIIFLLAISIGAVAMYSVVYKPPWDKLIEDEEQEEYLK